MNEISLKSTATGIRLSPVRHQNDLRGTKVFNYQ